MSRVGKNSSRDGFTLIELLVVLVGLALVAAAVVPALHGSGRGDDLDAVVSRVAATARYGRALAVDRQRTVAIVVETEPDGVRLVFAEEEPESSSARGSNQRGGAGVRSADAFVPLSSRIKARLEPAPTETLGGAPGSRSAISRMVTTDDDLLQFTPDGRSTGGVVVLTDERGRERHVIVTPETGVVRVER